MTAPGLPNSPERDAWCKEQKLRKLIEKCRQSATRLRESGFSTAAIVSEELADAVMAILAPPPPEDPRVEAVRDEMYDFAAKAAAAWSRGAEFSNDQLDEHARRILAAADAAEGGR